MQLSTMTKVALALTAGLSLGGEAWAQNLRVMGTTTGEGDATFNGACTLNGPSTANSTATFNGLTRLNGNVALGNMQFTGPMSVTGDVSMTSPDAGIHAIAMKRTNENGRFHAWYFWHMNSANVQDSLRIWEYQADATGNTCGGIAADGAMCSPRLTILKGGNVGIGYDPAFKLDVNGDVRSAGWLRTDGNQGWYSQAYGGGWHMTDTTWLRAYNDKNIWTNGVTASQAGLSVGYSGATPPAQGAVVAGRVGIGTAAPTQALDVNGRIRATQGTTIYLVGSSCSCPGLAGGLPPGVLTTSPTCPPCRVTGPDGNLCSCGGDGGPGVPNTPVGRMVDY